MTSFSSDRNYILTLTLEQVAAVIEGKRVLGHPREIQEVRNAFAAYEAMEKWAASSDKIWNPG